MQRRREGSTWGETFGFRSNRGGSVASKQGGGGGGGFRGAHSRDPSSASSGGATLYSSYDITFGEGPMGIEFMSNISERKWVLPSAGRGGLLNGYAY